MVPAQISAAIADNQAARLACRPSRVGPERPRCGAGQSCVDQEVVTPADLPTLRIEHPVSHSGAVPRGDLPSALRAGQP